jgi:hypothetical protein
MKGKRKESTMKNLFASVKNSKVASIVNEKTTKALDSKLVTGLKTQASKALDSKLVGTVKEQAVKAWDCKALVSMREQSIKAYESTMAMAKRVLTKDEAKAAIKMIETLIVKEEKLADYHEALANKAKDDESMEEDILVFHLEEAKSTLIRVQELKRSLNLMKVIYRMEEMMDGLDEQGKELLAQQLEQLRDELVNN